MAPLQAPHANMVPVGSQRRWERAPWQRAKRCLTIILSAGLPCPVRTQSAPWSRWSCSLAKWCRW